ncbi:MAG: PH domain-containing protein [Nocardioides sp.]
MASPPTEVTLPVTWRPLGVRVAVWFFGVMLAVVLVGAWIAIGADERAHISPYQRGTLIAMALGGLAIGYGLVRCKIVATRAGLEVVNGYRTHTFEWAEVLAVELSGGAPWATLDLADGTSVSALALQGADGERATRAVRQLRRLLAVHSAPGGGS